MEALLKENKLLIESLNTLLTNEMVAINQYMTHSEMLADWGYHQICAELEKRALDEMLHAEKIVKRILFLNGTPVLNQSKKSNIGSDITKLLRYDHLFEKETISLCDMAISIANNANDQITRNILEQILTTEIRHLNDIERLEGTA